VSLPENCDVLVVGGGPAGLSVAERAARGGARVTVVHQDREIGRPVRTSGGSFEADLQALGLPQHLYHRIDTLAFAADTARSSHAMTRHVMAVLDVTGLYQWLAAQAEEAGAAIHVATKFIGIEPQTKGYRATLRARGGITHTLSAHRVVDASGVAMAVWQAAGLGARPARTGIGIEAEYALEAGPDRTAVLIVGSRVPAGYGWIFPAPRGRVRIGAGVIQPDVDLSPRRLLETMITPDFLAKHGLRLGPLLDTNAGVIPAVPYETRLRHGGLIRTGDAANFATPTVGEGIRIAIQRGRMLGSALAQAPDRDEAALRAYERACRAAFRRDYAIGIMANRRLARYRPEDWDRSVRRLARTDQDTVAALIRSEFRGAALWHTLRREVMNRLSRGLSRKLIGAGG
jgi:digeranylgeranylglycerophospholipid reductase